MAEPAESSVLEFCVHYDFVASCWVARCPVTGAYGQGVTPTRAVQGCISAIRRKLLAYEEKDRG